jgi:hypothetical protein
MCAILWAAAIFIADLFKSRRRLRAENLLLRHQLAIALRRVPFRPQLSRSDRAGLVWITRLYPELLGLTQIVKPETILRWHRMDFELIGAGSRGSGQGGRRLTVACET